MLPSKAPRTQKDYMEHFKQLLPTFGHVPLDEIKPSHIKKYLVTRTAKVRANREISLFSSVYSYARDCGYTDKANPAFGVKRNKEEGRDRYITDAEFEALYKVANQVLKDALDLAYLTGQRVADVYKMKFTDIQDGILLIKQNKRKAKLRIEIEGQLKKVIARITQERIKAKIVNPYLLVDLEKNKNLTKAMQLRRMKVA